MDDLISRAAAIEAIISITAFESEDELNKFVEVKACEDYYLGGLCDAIDEIKDIPAVDAVPVVRCRDCKYAHMTYGGEVKYCDIISMPDGKGDYGYALYLPGDWFCADGERRESE